MAKKILVTGDVLKDVHIYQGYRSYPRSNRKPATEKSEEKGGSYLSYLILKQLGSNLNNEPYELSFGLNEDFLPKLNPAQTGYAIWKEYNYERGSNKKAWRVERRLGYGEAYEEEFDYNKIKKESDLLVSNIFLVDDSGAGFRKKSQKDVWPKFDCKECEWIVYKMSHPLGVGDLWQKLTKESALRNKLITVISIDDFRREDGMVSSGISWERTAMDMVYDFSFNPKMKKLLNSRHLIVSIRSAGALFVENANTVNKKFWLIYDPVNMEQDFAKNYDGGGMGYMSCLAASVSYHLAKNNDKTIKKSIKSGLSAMRVLLKEGHINITEENKGKKPEFSVKPIAEEIEKHSDDYSEVSIPQPDNIYNTDLKENWQIITGNILATKEIRPLYGLARRIALDGTSALGTYPYLKIKNITSADRFDIEQLRALKKIITDYEVYDNGEKPLSIGVFGPPGSGKSFGVKQIAKDTIPGVKILEFNLSQFNDSDLMGALHMVRDEVLRGNTPVVFWDEFDCREYHWLQYLLAPMQDGKFQDGQINHPIGKSIFIFAGGTSPSYESFGPHPKDEDNYLKFKNKKGPDFISRLNGYYNVAGTNMALITTVNDQGKRDYSYNSKDIFFPVRRAFLIRGILRMKDNQKLNMDPDLLSALLRIKEYKHGTRSIEKILNSIRRPGKDNFRKSEIPSKEIMNIHADYDEFLKLMNEEQGFRIIAEDLAPVIHDNFRRDEAKNEHELDEINKREYQNLPLAMQDDNIAAAIRISRILALIGMKVASKKDTTYQKISVAEYKKSIKENIDVMARAEHEGWMAQKFKDDWKKGDIKDELLKIHPSLIDYYDLPESEKEKDRSSIRDYKGLVEEAGFKIVAL